MTRNQHLAAVAATILLCSSYPRHGSACEGVEFHMDGSCDEPEDTVRFEVEVLDGFFDEYAVEWRASTTGVEVTCDPPDDPQCLVATIPCPDCASAEPPEDVSVNVHIVAPDDVSYCWAFVGFQPCSGDEDASVATPATLCQLLEDGQVTNPLLASVACTTGMLGIWFRRSSRRRGAL